MTTALIRLDGMSVTVAPQAREVIEAALVKAAAIARVTTDEECAAAKEILRDGLTVCKSLEKARKEAKAPVIKLEREIDAKAEDAISELSGDMFRINILVANYESDKLAAERSQRRIEAGEEGVENPIAPPPAPHRVEGVSSRPVWDFEVTDIHLLSNLHPGFVRIEPNRQEILDALARMSATGIEPKVAGLRVFQRVQISTRTIKPKTITV